MSIFQEYICLTICSTLHSILLPGEDTFFTCHECLGTFNKPFCKGRILILNTALIGLRNLY